MSTHSVTGLKERDILDVMREIESSRAVEEKPLEKGLNPKSSPAESDPAALLARLKDKQALINLLDGYAEAKGIVEKREELEEAIEFLEKIL